MDFTRKKWLLDFCLGGEILSIRDWAVERLGGEGGGQVGRVGGEQDQGEEVEDADQEPGIGIEGRHGTRQGPRFNISMIISIFCFNTL